MSRPRRERPLDLRERIMRCESRAEFDRLLREVAAETGQENQAFLAGIGADPTADADEPSPVTEDDALAATVASWAMREQAEINVLLTELMETHHALAEATGTDLREIPVPVIAWDAKLSKHQVNKRKRGKS